MSYIGKNIRKIRTTKGFSQAEFANIFGLTRASIGAYEEGRAEPKTEITISIAKYFSIPIDSLLTKEITVNEITKFNVKSYHGFEQHKTIDIPYISSSEWKQFITNNDVTKKQYISFPLNLIETELAVHYHNEIKNTTKTENIYLIFCSTAKNIEQSELYLCISTRGLSSICYGEKIKNEDHKKIYKIDFLLCHPQSDHNSIIESRLEQLEKVVFGKKK